VRTYDHQPSGTIDRARQLRRGSTPAEKLLWNAVRRRFPNYKFRRQMPIGPYFADVTCFAAHLVIEVDGGQHAQAGEYERSRTRFIERQGYRILRFWNNEVRDNLDGVIDVIARVLAPSPSQPLAGPLPLPAGEV
jgi:very-short-patch-repair endonuclease